MAATVLLVAVATAVVLLGGCSTPRSGSPSSSPAAQPVARPGAPVPPDLRSPVDAVKSYLTWSIFAYRMVNSDLATPTMSANEEVRVNSYIEMNRQKDRLLDQQLVSADFPRVRTFRVGKKALVATHEIWKYRYLTLKEIPASPWYDATYDATYTVITTKPGVWVVDSVEASSSEELK